MAHCKCPHMRRRPYRPASAADEVETTAIQAVPNTKRHCTIHTAGCLGHGGGHTIWTCRTCDTVVYGPPMAKHCTALNGPAAVRISTSRDT
jgi:hypothetical protein